MGDAAREILETVFGYEDFRPGQAEAVCAALAGRDVVVLQPTGSGKSLCYQVPALVAGRRGQGATIVVSPLIALMRDQVGALAARGARVAALHSQQDADDAARRRRALPARRARAVLRLARARGARQLPAHARAHARRAVRGRRGALREPVGPRLPARVHAARRAARRSSRAPMIALTATATAAVLAEIESGLGAARARSSCARASTARTSRSRCARCARTRRGSRRSWRSSTRPVCATGAAPAARSSTAARARSPSASPRSCARPGSRRATITRAAPRSRASARSTRSRPAARACWSPPTRSGWGSICPTSA